MEAIERPLDETDARLMDLLALDARRSNVDLAAELGLTEGAVRKRLMRLLRERFLRITAARNLRKLGYDIEVVIGLQVDQRRIPAIVQSLRSLPPVHSITVLTGRYDIILGASFQSRAALESFLVTMLPSVPGIARTDTSYVLSVPKRTCDWLDDDASEAPSIADRGAEKVGVNGASSPFGASPPQGWWRG